MRFVLLGQTPKCLGELGLSNMLARRSRLPIRLIREKVKPGLVISAVGDSRTMGASDRE